MTFAASTIDRQARPRDDIASLIANARVREEPIPRYEMISYFILMMTAGHDTTALAISGGMHALLMNPDQLVRLRQEPALLNTAIDEMLRWTSPVRHFMRTAVQDTRIGPKQILAGQSVALFFNSGNRDRAVFPACQTVPRSSARPTLISPSAGVRISAWVTNWRVWRCARFSRIGCTGIENIEVDRKTRCAHSTFMTGITSLPVRCTFRRKSRKWQKA